MVAAIGLTMADLSSGPQLVATYPYHDIDGTVVYTVERYSGPKTFRVREGLPVPAQRVLFAQQWITYARDTDQTLYVVEGEKDAVRLIEGGTPATTNVGGAGKWLPHYSDQLSGCDVVIIADADKTGKAHARTVATALSTVAKSVRVTVPGYGKDVSDLLDAGYGLDHLLPLEEDQPLPAVRANGVKPRRVSWAWPQYMPFGKLSTLEGDPGDGKSTLTVDLVARWTTGAPMPNGTAHDGPYDVLMVSAEDEPEDTVVPRLIAAGADLSRVHLLSSGTDPDRPFNLGHDLEALEKTVMGLGVRILVLDPLASFLPDDTDSHSDHKVRRALYPLHLLARRCNLSVICVRHLTKSATKAIYAGNGSIGIIAAARAAFLVAPAPGDDHARVLAPIKTNLAAKPPAIQYTVTMDPLHEVGRITWAGAVEVSAQDLMGTGTREHNATALQADAQDFLSGLVDHPMSWRQIVARGKEEGYTEITLRRARAGLLTLTRNPVAPDGTRLTGAYWHKINTDATDSDQNPELAQLAPCSRAPLHEQMMSKSTTGNDHQSLTVDHEAAVYAREKVCDICRSTTAVVFAAPWWTIRCRAHDPRRWTPT